MKGSSLGLNLKFYCTIFIKHFFSFWASKNTEFIAVTAIAVGNFVVTIIAVFGILKVMRHV